MRKLLIVLALMASSALFLGTANASAASCSTGVNVPPYRSGAYMYVGINFPCNGVDQVQVYDSWFHDASSSPPGYFWADVQTGNYVFTINTTPPHQLNNSASISIIRTPWCAAPYNTGHYIGAQYQWRIHNSAQGSWGPWHSTGSADYYTSVC